MWYISNQKWLIAEPGHSQPCMTDEQIIKLDTHLKKYTYYKQWKLDKTDQLLGSRDSDWIMLSLFSHPSGPTAPHGYGSDYRGSHSTQNPGSMFEEDLLGQRARGFSLGHAAAGFMSAPQTFPFAGFPMHPAHDPMGFTGKSHIHIKYLYMYYYKSICYDTVLQILSTNNIIIPIRIGSRKYFIDSCCTKFIITVSVHA